MANFANQPADKDEIIRQIALRFHVTENVVRDIYHRTSFVEGSLECAIHDALVVAGGYPIPDWAQQVLSRR